MAIGRAGARHCVGPGPASPGAAPLPRTPGPPTGATIAAMSDSLPVRPARDDEAAPATARVSVFELAGGQPFFDALVDRFYEGVEADPQLLAIYPDRAD